MTKQGGREIQSGIPSNINKKKLIKKLPPYLKEMENSAWNNKIVIRVKPKKGKQYV